MYINTARFLSYFTSDFGILLPHWGWTVGTSALASLIALVASFLCVILGDIAPPTRPLMHTLAAASQSFPLQAIAPFIFITLGTGFHIKVLISTLISFFPAFAAISSALRIPLFQISLSAFAARPTYLQTLFYFRIPHALPTLLSGIQIAFTLSVLGTVVSEFIYPDRGLGYLIIISQGSYNLELILACILLLVLQGLTVYTFLGWLKIRAFRIRGIQGD